MGAFNPTINKKYTKQKLDRILDELKSEKVLLTCGKHGYVARRSANGEGGVIPPQPTGCPQCWQAYFYTIHALTSPHLRYEHLQELEETVMKVCEMEDKGKFDFVPDLRPEIVIHKDAADEQGNDKIILTDGEN